MYKVIGIDEAGKGPVLGSMFIGFSIINLPNGLKEMNEYQELLRKIGVKDSKKLTPKKRNTIYQDLKQHMDIKYAQLTPALIDQNNQQGGKLNELEIQAIVQILESEKPQLVIIDALTSRPDKFGDDILKRLSFECKIISENKADDNYEIVGAASIIAKELREQEIQQININVANILSQSFKDSSQSADTDKSASKEATPESNLVGSGYPADPKTKAFLKEHYNNKEFDFIFRKSWQTYKDLVGGTKQKTLNDF